LRYTGPKDKLSRKFGEIISGMPDFELNKRPYPPGQHGQKRSKNSEYGNLLIEKQKLRISFGVTERQFRRVFKMASKVKGPTAEILIQLLETRLDNIVYRMGFAPTLPFARQMVAHGHVLVNSKKIDIPSYQVKPGQEISLKAKIKDLETVKKSLSDSPQVLDYLQVNKEEFTGKLVEMPKRANIPITVNDRLVVEFYSR